MFKPLEVLVISSQEHPNRYMGIRSRIFLIIFGLLSLSISITYIVAERDLVSTLKLQIVNELEKQAKALGIVVSKSVSSKTDFLITGESVGLSKLKSANTNDVSILTEE